jgi:hypothetical protein
MREREVVRGSLTKKKLREKTKKLQKRTFSQVPASGNFGSVIRASDSLSVAFSCVGCGENVHRSSRITPLEESFVKKKKKWNGISYLLVCPVCNPPFRTDIFTHRALNVSLTLSMTIRRAP